MAVLRLVPLAGAPIELDRDQAIVGREPGCDVFVNDGSVSRRHARLDRRGAAWFVVDQGSANGTYLDSQRVSDALLRPGQELRFGAVSFKVEIVGGGAPSAEGTILTPGGAMPYPPAPPAPPRPGVPPPPQWPGAPPPPAPPRPAPAAPAYPAPPSPAGAPPRPGGPPPGRPSGPPPPASTDTAPYAAGAPVRRPRPPRPVAEASAGPPAKPGRGPLFWGGVGCGGCLAVLFLLGAILGGFIYFSSRGPREAVMSHLQNVGAGNLEAAYAMLSASYREQVSAPAFAAFVARHPAVQQFSKFSYRGYDTDGARATVAGYVESAKGDSELATYTLMKEQGGWRIVSIDVGADHPEAHVEQAQGGLRLDSIEAQKTAAGNTVDVRIAVTAAGFEVRPQGGQYAIDLAVDVETIGPDGLRVDALSREDVQRFQRTTSMEKGAVAPIAIPLIVDRSLPPGTYTVRVRVRDRVGGGNASAETQLALP